MDSGSILSRLVAIYPVIEEIMSISGAVGLAIGIVYQGKVIHMTNFGYRNYAERLPVDSDTIFPICSMTKGLVSSVLATLVEERKLSWKTPVHQVLPSFAPRSAILRDDATLLGFLSMRSGIENYNVWLGSYNRVNIPKSKSMQTIDSLHSSAQLRYGYAYNNWSYEIAGHICEAVAKESWASMLHSKFFDPLHMIRTDAKGEREKYDNVAESYMVLDDKRPVRIPTSSLSGETLMGPAGGVQSCITDLMTLHRTVLKACISQFRDDSTSTPNNPFHQFKHTMSAHMPFPGPSLYESSYGMGWMRTQLPNVMSKISPNHDLLGIQPTVGEDAGSRLLIAHYGSMPGAYSGVILFPETESAIVVLCNTTPLCDLADWMTQLLTQTLFDFPNKIDVAEWVEKTADAELGWYERIVTEMKHNRKSGTRPRELSEYAGRYINASETLFMDVIQPKGERLLMRFQGLQEEEFALEHHQDDTFSWLHSRNDLVSRGQTVLQPYTYYLIRFELCNTGSIGRLFWTHDLTMPRGEEYRKVSGGKIEPGLCSSPTSTVA